MASPASPPRPLDPTSAKGKQQIVNIAVEEVAVASQSLSRQERCLLTRWVQQFMTDSLTVENLAKLIARERANARRTTGGAKPDVEGTLRNVLEAMDSRRLQAGIHYSGQLHRSPQDGLLGANLAHNKDIFLAPAGAFALFGALIPEQRRVDFLIIVWQVLESAKRCMTQMATAFREYCEAKEGKKIERSLAMRLLLAKVCAALGIDQDLANAYLLNVHKFHHTLYFDGMQATPALVYAGLAEKDAKVGTVNQLFSHLGHTMDEGCLSKLTAVINVAMRRFRARKTFDDKVALLRDLIEQHKQHLESNKGYFNVVGATRKQRIKEYVDVQEKIVKRPRTS